MSPYLLRIAGGYEEDQLGHSNARDAAMLWEAVSTCFFGFLRVGETAVCVCVSYCYLNYISVTELHLCH